MAGLVAQYAPIDMSNMPSYKGPRIINDGRNITYQIGTEYDSVNYEINTVNGQQYITWITEFHKLPEWQFGGPFVYTQGIQLDVSLAQAAGNGTLSSTQLYAQVLSGNDGVTGSDYNDVLMSYGGHDRLKGGKGNDTINGGTGMDYAEYSGSVSEYKITFYNGKPVQIDDLVPNRDGTDVLVDIEALSFKFGFPAFYDQNSMAGDVYRMYSAAFGRTPDLLGFSYWTKEMMMGRVNLRDLAYGFMESNEFKAKIGNNPPNELFVEKLYTNVLFRAPDVSGVNYWVSELASGVSRIDVLAGFTNSQENMTKTAPAFMAGVQSQIFAWGFDV